MGSRRIILTTVIALAAVTFMLWLLVLLRPFVSAAVRDSSAPYGRFAVLVPDAVQRVTRNFSARAADHAFLRDVMKHNEELHAKLLMLENATNELSTLRRELKLRQKHPSLIAAEVIGKGSGAWWKKLRIDKGSASGIELNDTVICANAYGPGVGLVGRICELTPNTADVLLISDPASKVSCRVEGKPAALHGIVKGGGIEKRGEDVTMLQVLSPLHVDYLDKDAELERKETIVTSGLGGIYPAGIPIGYVHNIRKADSQLYREADVTPFVDFTELSHVMVIRSALRTKPPKAPAAAKEKSEK